MKKFILLAGALIFSISGFSQMTLSDCIAYADSSNISLKQSEIARQNQAIVLETAKYSVLPTLNAKVGQNFSFGRATGNNNVIVNNNISTTSLSVGSSMPLFRGLQNYNQIKSDNLSLQAYIEDIKASKEDLALNIMAAYLDVLYNKEVVKISRDQLNISKNLVESSQIKFDAGKIAESDLKENQAQEADDELTLTQSQNDLDLARLTLCQLINFPDPSRFDIADMNISALMNTQANTLDVPNDMYNSLVERRPSIQAAKLRVQSSDRDVKVAQSAFFPQLSLDAYYNTGYYYDYSQANSNQNFATQFNNNGSEVVALSLSIPILNGKSAVNGVRQAKLTAANKQLVLDQARQDQYKQIQSSYYKAVAARKKYLAAQKTTQSSQTAFDFQKQKYESGTSSAFDYNQAKLRFEKAENQEAQAKYEYVFRTKIFLYYRGNSLTN